MIAAALLLSLLQAAPASAAPTAPTARLNLDTPIMALVADPKGKAVIDADLPTLQANPAYDTFKTFSLHQLQSYAPDRLTDTLLAKVATDLAAVK